jgi:hypothetical protein
MVDITITAITDAIATTDIVEMVVGKVVETIVATAIIVTVIVKLY